MITPRKHKPSKAKSSDSLSADLFAHQSLSVQSTPTQTALVTAPNHVQATATVTATATAKEPRKRISADDVTVIRSVIEEAGQAETIQVTADGLSGAGVSHLDDRSCARMTRGILLFCQGLRWKEISATLGINWAVWDAWTGPKAVKKLANVAMERKDRAIFQDILAAAQNEAANDQEEYVIGRVGKDKDGILKDTDGTKLKKRRPNTKMRELFLKAHDPRFKDAGGQAGSGGPAKQITYNISFGNVLIAPPPQPPPMTAIEADFKDGLGGNSASKSPFG